MLVHERADAVAQLCDLGAELEVHRPQPTGLEACLRRRGGGAGLATRRRARWRSPGRRTGPTIITPAIAIAGITTSAVPSLTISVVPEAISTTRERRAQEALRRLDGEVAADAARPGPSRAGCSRRARSRRCRRPSARCPAAQSRTAAWKMSVPTTRCGVSRKIAISAIAIRVPLPAEVRPMTKPVTAPVTIAATMWRRVEVHRRALLDHVREEDRAQQGRDADDQQGAADHPEHELVERPRRSGAAAARSPRRRRSPTGRCRPRARRRARGGPSSASGAGSRRRSW